MYLYQIADRKMWIFFVQRKWMPPKLCYLTMKTICFFRGGFPPIISFFFNFICCFYFPNSMRYSLFSEDNIFKWLFIPPPFFNCVNFQFLRHHPYPLCYVGKFDIFCIFMQAFGEMSFSFLWCAWVVSFCALVCWPCVTCGDGFIQVKTIFSPTSHFIHKKQLEMIAHLPTPVSISDGRKY
jgi:hypothetical protein